METKIYQYLLDRGIRRNAANQMANTINKKYEKRIAELEQELLLMKSIRPSQQEIDDKDILINSMTESAEELIEENATLKARLEEIQMKTLSPEATELVDRYTEKYNELKADVSVDTFVEIATLKAQLAEANEKADHWEKTCHAQWESSQQSVDDCNRLARENATLKAENELLTQTFQHAFLDSGTDKCGKCGLDIRNLIHLRISVPKGSG